MGTGTSPGTNTMSTYFPGGTFTGNVLGATDPYWPPFYPAGFWFPTEAELEAGFVNYAAGDYRVKTTVAWSGSGAQ